MLRVKYIENFINNQPFVVIVSDRYGFQKAYDYFSKKNGAYLCDQSITDFFEIEPLIKEELYLNTNECREIANIFKNLIYDDAPKHDYFDIEALPKIEIFISYLEYTDLF
jgi:hypothetical protein